MRRQSHSPIFNYCTSSCLMWSTGNPIMMLVPKPAREHQWNLNWDFPILSWCAFPLYHSLYYLHLSHFWITFNLFQSLISKHECSVISPLKSVLFSLIVVGNSAKLLHFGGITHCINIWIIRSVTMSSPALRTNFTVFNTNSDVFVVFLFFILHLTDSQTMSLSLSRLRVTQKALQLTRIGLISMIADLSESM